MHDKGREKTTPEFPQLKTHPPRKRERCPAGGAPPSKSTGPGASQARLLPTALVGPAQQGREPCPIILPRIAIGVSVAPNVPAPPAGAPLAIEHRATLVLTPITNEEKGEETGAHEQHSEEEEGAEAVEELITPPPAVPGQERGYPVITSPIPDPADLHHPTPFPSAPVGHRSPRRLRNQ